MNQFIKRARTLLIEFLLWLLSLLREERVMANTTYIWLDEAQTQAIKFVENSPQVVDMGELQLEIDKLAQQIATCQAQVPTDDQIRAGVEADLRAIEIPQVILNNLQGQVGFQVAQQSQCDSLQNLRSELVKTRDTILAEAE